MSYNILIIDDDAEYLKGVNRELKKIYNTFTAGKLSEGLAILSEQGPSIDLVLLDVSLPDASQLDGFYEIKKACPFVDIVLVTANKDPKFIVKAVRSGVADYITKPYEIDELIAVIEKLQIVKDIRDGRDALVANLNFMNGGGRLLGASKAFREILSKAARLKGHKANILIIGESGTGKELLARYIHSFEDITTPRPFIAVNCAAIPEGLIESELFGHEKGAFTGAVERKIGKFELANGGDIFLDEVSTLKPDIQAKILRVLQEKEIIRVGGNTVVATDFRVIAATNLDLVSMVDAGGFRMDLYHRLRVVQLSMPPLRERKEDIPMLIACFLEKYSRGGAPKKITPEAASKLQKYNWPGNVRELENVVHSMAILTPDALIEERHLPEWALNGCGENGNGKGGGRSKLPDIATTPFREYIRQMEASYISQMLALHGGDKSRAAGAMQISRSKLYAKIRQLSLFGPDAR